MDLSVRALKVPCLFREHPQTQFCIGVCRLTSYVQMSQPATLILDLEVARDSHEDENVLVLDLWKGFSATIKIILINQNPGPEPESGNADWLYHLAVIGDAGLEDVIRPSQIHLARAFSKGLLIIKDAAGAPILIDNTADWDLWSIGRHWQNEPANRCYHHLSLPSPSLLQQFRRKLKPGCDYTLQFASKTYPIEFVRRYQESATGEQDTQEQIREYESLEESSESHIRAMAQRELEQLRSVDCAPTSLRFHVSPGTPIPRFEMSVSATSPYCKLSGDNGFALIQVIKSLAEKPIKVALVDSTGKKNLFRWTCVEWSYNGFPHMLTLTIRDRAHWLRTTQYPTWENHETFFTPSHLKIIAGEYRRNLKIAGYRCEPNSAAATSSSMAHSRSSLGSHTSPLQVLQVVLCPGDQLVQQYAVGQEFLDSLIPQVNYGLHWKRHCCRYWTYITDDEITKSPELSLEEFSDHGPIWFDAVSEVALTLESIFENARPQPFFKLPYELGKEIYNYLRYKETANSLRFLP